MKYIFTLGFLLVIGALLLGYTVSGFEAERARYESEARQAVARYQSQAEQAIASYQSEAEQAKVYTQLELARIEAGLESERLHSLQVQAEQRAEIARAYAPVVIGVLLVISLVGLLLLISFILLAIARERKRREPGDVIFRYQILPPDSRRLTGREVVPATPITRVHHSYQIPERSKQDEYQYKS